MIHHLARALSVRQQGVRPLPQEPIWAQDAPSPDDARGRRPIRPRPLTPWQVRPTPARPEAPASGPATPSSTEAAHPGVRICTDPTDARRTVIAGRFEAVCAALDRLVHEQEAMA